MDGKSGLNVIRYVGVHEAAEIARNADRILVIGCSGSGKSTLSQRIAARFGLTYISIDRDILWLPGWVQRDKDEQLSRTVELIGGDRWIMDGTNTSTFDIRVPRSDLVIWPHLPRRVCIRGIVSRWIKYMGRTRPEMAPGCPEKIDWDFLKFVWTWDSVFKPRVIAGLRQHARGKPVLKLKSRRELNDFVALLEQPWSEGPDKELQVAPDRP